MSKNIAGVKLKARATGDLMSKNLNLEATLKRVSTPGTSPSPSPLDPTPSSGGSNGGNTGGSSGNEPIDGPNGD